MEFVRCPRIEIPFLVQNIFGIDLSIGIAKYVDNCYGYDNAWNLQEREVLKLLKVAQQDYEISFFFQG